MPHPRFNPKLIAKVLSATRQEPDSDILVCLQETLLKKLSYNPSTSDALNWCSLVDAITRQGGKTLGFAVAARALCRAKPRSLLAASAAKKLASCFEGPFITHPEAVCSTLMLAHLKLPPAIVNNDLSCKTQILLSSHANTLSAADPTTALCALAAPFAAFARLSKKTRHSEAFFNRFVQKIAKNHPEPVASLFANVTTQEARLPQNALISLVKQSVLSLSLLTKKDTSYAAFVAKYNATCLNNLLETAPPCPTPSWRMAKISYPKPSAPAA